MRLVDYSGLKLKIPESWADVTLEHYNAALAALTEHQAVPRKAVAMAICKLCDIKENILIGMTRAHVMQLRESLAFFFDTQPEPRLLMEFELGGTIFHVPTEIEGETFGEFIDLDSTITHNKEDLRKALAPILAIYCRPQGEVYNAPDLKERTAARIKLMGQMPIELAEGLSAFFLTCIQQRQPITLLYGQSRISLTLRVRTLVSSQNRTGGWRPLRNWLRTKFLMSIRSRLGDAGMC